MVSDNCDMAYCIQHSVSPKVEMIEQNFLQICKDDKIAFQTVTNIMSKMIGISSRRKYCGWKYKFQGSLKIKAAYMTPCKLKWPPKHHTV